MSALGSIGIVVAALIFGVLGAVIGGLVSKEVRRCLDSFLYAVLRLAVKRLPRHLRKDRLAEWTGELHECLCGAHARPVTRLVRGTGFAVGVFRVAASVGRTVADHGHATRARRSGTWSAIFKARVSPKIVLFLSVRVLILQGPVVGTIAIAGSTGNGLVTTTIFVIGCLVTLGVAVHLGGSLGTVYARLYEVRLQRQARQAKSIFILRE